MTMTNREASQLPHLALQSAIGCVNPLSLSRRQAIAMAIASCAGSWRCSVVAQTKPEWPLRPVKIVVPYSAGGSADTLGRFIADHLSSTYKQPFVIENRGGAGGTLGSIAVSKAAPDGYTLVLSGIGSHVIAPLQLSNGMNPMRDFTHLALLGGPPSALVVNAALPIKDIKAFIAYANSTPKGLSWGSPGLGTHAQLIGELFAESNKLNMVHISYKGAGPAVMDLLGGQIQAGFMTLRSASSHIQSGKLRALAVTSAKRLKDHPDVPTFAELGYPKLTAITWFSVSGPSGMPKGLVANLNAEIRRGLRTPNIREQLVAEDIETQDLDPEAFNQFFRFEIEKWSPLVRSLQQPKS